MATRKSKARSPRPPATTPEGRENQLIALAVDVAEEQLRSGSASAQVITHFLKLATERERLERQKLKGETELVKAKVDSLASAGRIEKLYENALIAMRSYAGLSSPDEIEDQ